MEKAYLALGSNIGSRLENIRSAVDMIGADISCRVEKKSSFYLTKPVGVEDQPDFVNAVVSVETSLTPRELLVFCKDIELKLGRTKTFRWGPRVIDIDVILYDDVTIEEDDFVIPHPRMMERSFVLVPLAEIEPGTILPGGITVEEAVEHLDRSGIEIMEEVDWVD